MKDRLIEIFDSLKKVETRGDSTVVMADCLRALANVINSIPETEVSNVKSE